jgi:hypothetical protein
MLKMGGSQLRLMMEKHFESVNGLRVLIWFTSFSKLDKLNLIEEVHSKSYFPVHSDCWTLFDAAGAGDGTDFHEFV